MKYILILALLMASSGPMVMAQTNDEFTYAAFGPYWVGRQELVVDDRTEDVLVTTIWYPALNPDAAGQTPESNEYRQLDLVPDDSQGPYPLVIFSHGFGANAANYATLIEHIASYGFVVIAPSHIHDEDDIFDGSIAIRVHEVKQAIDFADFLNGAGGALEGVIDTETIAVMGHSAGAITTFGAGGAPMNLNSIEAAPLCPDDNDPLCDNLEADIQTVLSTYGLESAPADGILPPAWDERVDAIIPIAGYAYHYGLEGIQQITIPAMFIYGSKDAIIARTPEFAEAWVYPIYESLGNSQKAEVVLIDAGHGISQEGQREPQVKHFTVAFLLANLNGDADAIAALSPDAAQLEGVEYQAQGF